MKTSIKFLIFLPLLASCGGNQPKNVQSQNVKPAKDTFHYVLELPQEEAPNDPKLDSIYAEQERRKMEKQNIMQSDKRTSIVERSIERADSTIANRFDSLSTAQISSFLDVWSAASARHAKAQRDKVCDRAVQLIFDNYFSERDRKPYLVLPPSVEVYVYDRELDISVGYEDYREKTKNPVTIYLCVPHLKTKSKILYHFNAVNGLLDSFIKKDSGRNYIVKEYLNIVYRRSYGWKRWLVGDYPHYHSISIFPNGVVVCFSTSIDHSETVFIPKEKDEIIFLSCIDDDYDYDFDFEDDSIIFIEQDND